jgi:outer membrane protein assembly factor BamB
VLSDDGVLTLAEATPAGYNPLDEAELFVDGEEAWAPMAMAGGRLLLRDRTRLKCIDVAAP